MSNTDEESKMYKADSGCLRSKDELDALLDASVDARLINSDQVAGGSAIKPTSSVASQFLQKHLDDCTDCQHYQMANRILVETARELPQLAYDPALTDSIMAMFDAEVAGSLKTAPEAVEAPERLRAANKLPLMALSFAVFMLVASGFSPEGLWSAGAWTVALAMVALLKPLVEQHPNRVMAN